MFDFANLLFSGPCSARCYFCIGRQVNPGLNQPNLDTFPPSNLDRFIDLVCEYGIHQVVMTGTNTDPQLYRYESRLLDLLRRRLPPVTRLSLHTNGRQALRKLAVFNQYDRVSLSFPSFNPLTYRQIMGVSNPPDLEAILSAATIPVKISCVLDFHNLPELPGYLKRCQDLGMRRLVLRKLYGGNHPWLSPANLQELDLQLSGVYRGNPVFTFGDMEVTLWDFERSESTSINLFADGTISQEYILANTPLINLTGQVFPVQSLLDPISI